MFQKMSDPWIKTIMLIDRTLFDLKSAKGRTKGSIRSIEIRAMEYIDLKSVIELFKII